MVQCILVDYLLKDMDIIELHEQVDQHLEGNILALTFDALESRHKRWSFYWCYAVNYFHIRGEPQELLTCLVNAIREKYPKGKTESHTGFKK